MKIQPFVGPELTKDELSVLRFPLELGLKSTRLGWNVTVPEAIKNMTAAGQAAGSSLASRHSSGTGQSTLFLILGSRARADPAGVV